MPAIEYVHALDLRTTLDPDVLSIVFTGRDPSPPESLGGHSYVLWGHDPASLPSAVTDAWGFYPVNLGTSATLSYVLGPVPGGLRPEEWWKEPSDVRLIVKLNKTDFDASLALRRIWTTHNYQTLVWDCTTFVADAARAIGLVVPARSESTPSTWFPSSMLRAMADANPQSRYLDGRWQSTDPQHRWRLEITRDRCSWIQRNATGGELRRQVTLERSGDVIRISRPNDAEVLAYLGARPGVLSAILARTPPASYMILKRGSVSSLSSQWNGLRWTLDAHNNLVTIVAPGGSPQAVDFARQ